MGKDLYSRPVTEELNPVVADLPKVAEAAVVKVIDTTPVLNYEIPEGGRVVLVSDMVNAKSSAVTDTYLVNINRYLGVLGGTIGVPVDKLNAEQTNFMKTVFNTLDLGFREYALVTDALVLKMLAHKDSVNETTLFHLLYDLPVNAYPRPVIERYKQYMMALLTLSRNLPNRARVKKLVDIPSLAAQFKTKQAENISQYLSRNYA